MKLVYIAGPFTADTAWGIESNVRDAERLAYWVCQEGAFPVVPHANTRFFHGSFSPTFFYAGTLELLRRCDAVLLMHGWRYSPGACNENSEALRLGIPVFSDTKQLAAWLDDDSTGIRKGGLHD